MKPSVGRIVHYRSRGGILERCMAAVITDIHEVEVEDESDFRTFVSLTVFTPDSINLVGLVPEGDPESDEGNRWHWPERVEE
jgi:hypothetical protein